VRYFIGFFCGCDLSPIVRQEIGSEGPIIELHVVCIIPWFT